MSEWKEVSLGEILQFQRGFDLLAKDRHDGNVPVVSSSGITGYHNTAKAKSPGVIIGRKGTLGTVHYVDTDYWPHDTTLWIKNFKGNLPKFIYYFLKVMRLENYDVGASNPTLNRNHLHKIRLKFPLLPVQKKIAAILSAYDDLIEKSNRRIAILEKMAEEIYREWFVRLRFPGHEQVKFNKGIPEGWEVKPFSQLVYINPGETISKSESKPYVGMENLSLNSMLFEHEEYRTGIAGSKFRNHDVLFPRITPSLENGKRGYVLNLNDNQVGLGSTEFIIFRKKILGSEYIYFTTCLSEFRKHAEQSMVGASGRQRVHEGCFDTFLIKTPPKYLMDSFSTIVKPLFFQIKVIYNSTKNLKQTRDRLLTRLIYGKLSVEDLDIQFPPSMREELE